MPIIGKNVTKRIHLILLLPLKLLFTISTRNQIERAEKTRIIEVTGTS